jgi:dihydroflavonol-4-reductase
MAAVPTVRTVCVTGAAGFIASHVVRLLLERGFHVRGTVRTLLRARDWEHLRALPGAAERLSLFQASLGLTGSFDEAVAGSECVVHTASPYVIDAPDPQLDLVDPAVNGTRNVLEACARARTVRRVVYTSSMAAMTDEPDPVRPLTEEDWNTRSTLTRNPYYLSKTLAERAAWEFLERRWPAFDLVAINPFLVIGPSLGPCLNTTNKIFADLLRGVYPAVMRLWWGLVDVRDVALVHVLAMEKTVPRGRYLCATPPISMREVVNQIRRAGYDSGYRLPRVALDSPAGDWIVRLASFFRPRGEGSYLRTHVGRKPLYDTGRIRTGLGIRFRPTEVTIRDTLRDLERWGHLARRTRPPTDGLHFVSHGGG